MTNTGQALENAVNGCRYDAEQEARRLLTGQPSAIDWGQVADAVASNPHFADCVEQIGTMRRPDAMRVLIEQAAREVASRE